MFAKYHSLLAMRSSTPWLPHLDHHAVYHSPLHPLIGALKRDQVRSDWY